MVSKKEFESKYAEVAGVTKAEAGKSVDAFLETVQHFISTEEGFKFVGFFSAEVVSKDAHQGRNPQTGEKITIPAQKTVKFKVGKPLKEIANA